MAGSRVTVSFFLERYVGFGGCNTYLGIFDSPGNELFVSTPARTPLACEDPEGVMVQEGTFLDALLNARTYQIQGERLTIASSSGQRLLSLLAQEPFVLEGPTWVLNWLNAGGAELDPVLAGTEPTAEIEGGQLTGSAGCNTYSGSIELDGENLSIGPVAVTEKFCADPEGIMAQEMQYLTTLSSASSFQIVGDQLVLRNTEGAPLLLFSAR